MKYLGTIILAQFTNKFIQDSNGIIVTEYCKKQETWEKYKKVEYTLSDKFLEDLISETLMMYLKDVQTPLKTME